jgi:hypothetical protein
MLGVELQRLGIGLAGQIVVAGVAIGIAQQVEAVCAGGMGGNERLEFFAEMSARASARVGPAGLVGLAELVVGGVDVSPPPVSIARTGAADSVKAKSAARASRVVIGSVIAALLGRLRRPPATTSAIAG